MAAHRRDIHFARRPQPSRAGQTRIDEWRTVKDVKFPRRIRNFHSGICLAEITTKSVTLNGGLRIADLTAKPADLTPVLRDR